MGDERLVEHARRRPPRPTAWSSGRCTPARRRAARAWPARACRSTARRAAAARGRAAAAPSGPRRRRPRASACRCRRSPHRQRRRRAAWPAPRAPRRSSSARAPPGWRSRRASPASCTRLRMPSAISESSSLKPSKVRMAMCMVSSLAPGRLGVRHRSQPTAVGCDRPLQRASGAEGRSNAAASARARLRPGCHRDLQSTRAASIAPRSSSASTRRLAPVAGTAVSHCSRTVRPRALATRHTLCSSVMSPT